MMGAIGNNGGQLNSGRIWVELKPREERTLSVDHVIAALRPKMAQLPGIRAFMTNQPPINLGAGQGGQRALYQFTLQDTDTAELYKYAPIMEDKLRAIPGIEDVSSDLLLKNPQVTVEMDRNRVATLGLTANQVENALYNAYGTRQVSQIYAPNNQYQVIMQVAPEFQKDPAALSLLYVRSNNGTLIPLESVARLKTAVGPLSVSHYGQLPAVTISFNLRPGLASATPWTRSSAVAAANLPSTMSTSFQGAAQAFQDSLQGLGLILLMADRRHLHRAGHALRELHAPADDSLGPAVGRLRRAADAADLQDRAQPLRVRRRHHAGRHREEERHHDGGLRRRGAEDRQDAARGHSRGLSRPLPPHHDDDDGGAGRHAADRPRAGAPARNRGGRSAWRSSAA